MPLKNHYTATSVSIGDVFAVIVTCHVTSVGLKFYRCKYPHPDTADNIPQGEKYPNWNLADLFPTIRDWSELDDEEY